LAALDPVLRPTELADQTAHRVHGQG
jgi:hypothetical protein